MSFLNPGNLVNDLNPSNLLNDLNPFNLFFNIWNLFISMIESIPIIGPIIKKILGCFHHQVMIVALIPCITLFLRNGNENLLATGIVIAIFYVLSIVGAITLQNWDCPNQENQSLWDKITLGIQQTWFIPFMFTVFMIINFVIRLPMFYELEEITFLITFFIQNNFLFFLVMYFIAWIHYCDFSIFIC